MGDNGNKNNLSSLLIELRTKKNMTQKELAEKLMVSDKTISRWETGGNLPDMEMLYSISKFFKVSMNDLAILRVASKEGNEDIVQDIIKDFTKKDKQRQRIIKIILLILLIMVVIFTSVFIFSQSYNRFKVYNVNIISDDIYPRDGVYVETKIKDSLYISNIAIKNYTFNNEDTVTVDLYYIDNDKEYILYSYSSLNNIRFIDQDSYIKIDDLSNYFDKLYIRIIILNSNNKEKVYTGKLQFVLDFSNNKIYNNDKKITNNPLIQKNKEEIKDILLKNGFEQYNEYVLCKSAKNSNSYYIINSNKLEYSYESHNYIYRYSFNVNSNTLEVNIFNENNIEIENYKYDVTNDKVIDCNIGKCNSYKEAMKTLEDNILYLLK